MCNYGRKGTSWLLVFGLGYNEFSRTVGGKCFEIN